MSWKASVRISIEMYWIMNLIDRQGPRRGEVRSDGQFGAAVRPPGADAISQWAVCRFRAAQGAGRAGKCGDELQRAGRCGEHQAGWGGCPGPAADAAERKGNATAGRGAGLLRGAAVAEAGGGVRGERRRAGSARSRHAD